MWTAERRCRECKCKSLVGKDSKRLTGYDLGGFTLWAESAGGGSIMDSLEAEW